MDRVYQSNAIETPPSSVASSGSYPTAGSKASGQLATVPGPYWFYTITEEIRNAIIAAGITPDSAQVNQLAAAMAKFLPLSGGTMTGAIKTSFEEFIRSSTNDSGVRIYGGTGYGNGSYISLRGKDYSEKGIFTICANDGTNNKLLKGSPDGTLTWSNNNVLTDNYTNAWIINRELGHIYKKDANGRMVIRGGTSAGTDGATLQLSGNGYSGEPGYFKLIAHDGTNGKSLIGQPNGTLSWAGKNVNVDLSLKTASKVAMSTGTWTATGNGMVLHGGYSSGWGGQTLTVNGVTIDKWYGKECGAQLQAIVRKGDVVVTTDSNVTERYAQVFIPFN